MEVDFYFPQNRPKATIHQYNIGNLIERIVVDITGPFPAMDQGNKYILAVMDYFSIWIGLCDLSDQEATHRAEVLVRDWRCLEKVRILK